MPFVTSLVRGKVPLTCCLQFQLKETRALHDDTSLYGELLGMTRPPQELHRLASSDLADLFDCGTEQWREVEEAVVSTNSKTSLVRAVISTNSESETNEVRSKLLQHLCRKQGLSDAGDVRALEMRLQQGLNWSEACIQQELAKEMHAGCVGEEVCC